MDNNTTECPFCLQNRLLDGSIIQETEVAYVMENSYHPGNFLIIPKAHITDIQKLPDSWWTQVNTMLNAIQALGKNYNISLNIGELAGQTQPHLHFWVIPRSAKTGVPNKGLLGLIKVLEEQQSQVGN